MHSWGGSAHWGRGQHRIDSGSIMTNPRAHVAAFNRVLRDQLAHLNPEVVKNERISYQVGFEGNFGRNHVTPRSLSSDFINRLICIDGIVTKCRGPWDGVCS